LVEHRSPLRRRLREVTTGNTVVPAAVPDVVDLRRIGVDSGLAVPDDGTVFPAPFQQLVEDLQVFVGHVVAFVVRRQPAEAEVLAGALEVRSHDVPGEPSPGEMIERRELLGEDPGVLLEDRTREGKPQMLRRVSHDGDEETPDR
jgi:hypothetical protein